jgi:hypothetical protein
MILNADPERHRPFACRYGGTDVIVGSLLEPLTIRLKGFKWGWGGSTAGI